MSLGEEQRANDGRNDLSYISSVAMDATGAFVIAWDAHKPPSAPEDDVFVRRFDAGGSPLGEAFRANLTTSLYQSSPAVAMSRDGRSVVVWDGTGLDDEEGVWLQLYDVDGAPIGIERRVNTRTDAREQDADVAMAADGSFVIVWRGDERSGDQVPEDLFFQRYNVDGTPAGNETQVPKISATNFQSNPAVAVRENGDFAIAWATEAFPDTMVGLQRYDANGMPLGEAVQVNTTTIVERDPRSISVGAAAASSGFVIVWSGVGPDGHYDVLMQRYGWDGVPSGEEVLVNITTAGDQGRRFGAGERVAMASDGSIAVVWDGLGQTDDEGVFLRRYAADGTPLGGEVRVNTGTEGRQTGESVAMDADGDVLVSWYSFNCLGTTNVNRCVEDGEIDYDVLESEILFQRFAGYEPVDLSVVLTATPDSVTAGGGVSYSVIVTNEHPLTEDSAVGTATGLQATLELPEGIELAGVSGDGWTCSDDLPAVCGSDQPLAPLEFTTLTVDVVAPAAAGTLDVSVDVDAHQFDPDFESNSAEQAVEVTASNDSDGSGDGGVSGGQGTGSGGGGGTAGWLTLLGLLALGCWRVSRLPPDERGDRGRYAEHQRQERQLLRHPVATGFGGGAHACRVQPVAFSDI